MTTTYPLRELLRSHLRSIAGRAKSWWISPSVAYAVGPLLLLCVLLTLYFFHQGETFTTKTSGIAANVLREGIPLCLLALAASLVLATGAVDISISGVATAAGVVFAILSQSGWPTWAALPVALVMVTGPGAILGWLVGAKDAPSLILSWSLGSLWVITSLVAAATAETRHLRASVSGVSLPFTLPDGYWRLSGFGIRSGTVVVLLLIWIIAVANLSYKFRAVGANRDSAAYAGVRTTQVTIVAYTLSAFLSGLAGIQYSLLMNSASTTDILGKELMAIAIAVLGGTVMSGGYLNLSAVACTALFWAGLRTLTTTIPWEETRLRWLTQIKPQYLANACFALVLVTIMLLLGRRLSGKTITIHTEHKTRRA